jgi:hypothetical protein
MTLLVGQLDDVTESRCSRLSAYLKSASEEFVKVLRAATQNDAVDVDRSVTEFHGEVGESGIVEVCLVQRRWIICPLVRRRRWRLHG